MTDTERLILRALYALVTVRVEHPDWLAPDEIKLLRNIQTDLASKVFSDLTGPTVPCTQCGTDIPVSVETLQWLRSARVCHFCPNCSQRYL